MNKPNCVITGATGGVGAELAKIAAQRGYNLVLHGRKQDELEGLKSKLANDFPDIQVKLVAGDLGTSNGAQNVAQQILDLEIEIDILFNNAGVLLDRVLASPDGVEIHTQVNLIAPFVLMHLLTAPVSQAGGAIINVSSSSMFRARDLSLDELENPKSFSQLAGPYARSKLALSVVTYELADRFGEKGVSVLSASPGASKTGMTSSRGLPWFVRLLGPLFFGSANQGAAKLFAAYDSSRKDSQPGAFYDGEMTKDLPKLGRINGIGTALIEFCRSKSGL